MPEIESLAKVLPYLIPLGALIATLLAVALVDLIRRRHVTGGNKIVWALVIVLIQVIGPVIYLMAGRKEEEVASD